MSQFVRLRQPDRCCCLQGMLVIASLIAALAGLTGASSLARCLSNATGQPQGTSVHSRKVQAQGQAPLAGKVLGHAHSFPVPASLSSQASLIASLLDDAEIQLRVLARQKPGPQRRCTVFSLTWRVVRLYHIECLIQIMLLPWWSWTISMAVNNMSGTHFDHCEARTATGDAMHSPGSHRCTPVR